MEFISHCPFPGAYQEEGLGKRYTHTHIWDSGREAYELSMGILRMSGVLQSALSSSSPLTAASRGEAGI
jgi:hypothetical protein